MPIVAILPAVFAVGAAAEGLATVGLTLMTALETVAAVGATLGAIGAVTGDKTLGTIGMIMGAVGGIGSIAASAGLFGAGATTTPLFGEGAASAASMGGDVAAGLTAAEAAQTTNLAASGIPDMAAVVGSPATAAAPDVFSALAPGTTPASSAGSEAAGLEGGATSAAAAETAAPAASAPAAANIANAPTGLINQAAIDPIASPVESVTVTAPSAPVAEVPNAPAVTPAQGGSGIVGSLGKFAKENPLVAYGVVQAAGSFLAGATNPLTPAQVSALKAQAAANQANADQTAQQNANSKEPIPIARRVKAGGGLINYAPANAVTGAVA